MPRVIGNYRKVTIYDQKHDHCHKGVGLASAKGSTKTQYNNCARAGTKCNSERASLHASTKTKCKTYKCASLASVAQISVTPSLPWNYTGF